MIIWLILAAMADFILFALGLVLSFAINKPLRPAVRIATVLLGIPLIPTGYFIAVPDALIPLAWNAPRNLTELDNGFPSKRADLETLLRMSGEDREFSEIAPDFVNRNAGVSGKSTKYERPDPQIALPRARWDQYRSLFAHNGIKLGLMRSLNGDVLIEIDTIGLFTRGRVVAYAHCAPEAAAGVPREFPCDHTAEAAGPSFRRLDGAWFAFEE